jgi:hypothetical protein
MKIVCQKPPIKDRIHICSITKIIKVVFEHAQKFFRLQMKLNFIHQFKISGKFLTFLFFILLLIIGCKNDYNPEQCKIECENGFVEGTCECNINIDDIFIDDDTIEPPVIPN